MARRNALQGGEAVALLLLCLGKWARCPAAADAASGAASATAGRAANGTRRKPEAIDFCLQCLVSL